MKRYLYIGLFLLNTAAIAANLAVGNYGHAAFNLVACAMMGLTLRAL